MVELPESILSRFQTSGIPSVDITFESHRSRISRKVNECVFRANVTIEEQENARLPSSYISKRLQESSYVCDGINFIAKRAGATEAKTKPLVDTETTRIYELSFKVPNSDRVTMMGLQIKKL